MPTAADKLILLHRKVSEARQKGVVFTPEQKVAFRQRAQSLAGAAGVDTSAAPAIQPPAFTASPGSTAVSLPGSAIPPGSDRAPAPGVAGPQARTVSGTSPSSVMHRQLFHNYANIIPPRGAQARPPKQYATPGEIMNYATQALPELRRRIQRLHAEVMSGVGLKGPRVRGQEWRSDAPVGERDKREVVELLEMLTSTERALTRVAHSGNKGALKDLTTGLTTPLSSAGEAEEFAAPVTGVLVGSSLGPLGGIAGLNIGTMPRFVNALRTFKIAGKPRAKRTPAENEFLVAQAAAGMTSQNVLQTIGEGIAHLIPYMLEIGVGTRTAQPLLKKLGLTGENLPLLKKVLESGILGAYTTFVNPVDAAARTVEYMTPSYMAEVDPETKELVARMESTGDTFWKALGKGVGVGGIEMLTEQLGWTAGRIAGKVVGKGFSLAKLDKGVKGRAVRDKVIAWMAGRGRGRVADIMRKGGMHGFVGEFAEELYAFYPTLLAEEQPLPSPTSREFGKFLLTTMGVLAVPTALGLGGRSKAPGLAQLQKSRPAPGPAGAVAPGPAEATPEGVTPEAQEPPRGAMGRGIRELQGVVERMPEPPGRVEKTTESAEVVDKRAEIVGVLQGMKMPPAEARALVSKMDIDLEEPTGEAVKRVLAERGATTTPSQQTPDAIRERASASLVRMGMDAKEADERVAKVEVSEGDKVVDVFRLALHLGEKPVDDKPRTPSEQLEARRGRLEPPTEVTQEPVLDAARQQLARDRADLKGENPTAAGGAAIWARVEEAARQAAEKAGETPAAAKKTAGRVAEAIMRRPVYREVGGAAAEPAAEKPAAPAAEKPPVAEPKIGKGAPVEAKTTSRGPDRPTQPPNGTQETAAEPEKLTDLQLAQQTSEQLQARRTRGKRTPEGGDEWGALLKERRDAANRVIDGLKPGDVVVGVDGERYEVEKVLGKGKAWVKGADGAPINLAVFLIPEVDSDKGGIVEGMPAAEKPAQPTTTPAPATVQADKFYLVNTARGVVLNQPFDSTEDAIAQTRSTKTEQVMGEGVPVQTTKSEFVSEEMHALTGKEVEERIAAGTLKGTTSDLFGVQHVKGEEPGVKGGEGELFITTETGKTVPVELSAQQTLKGAAAEAGQVETKDLTELGQLARKWLQEANPLEDEGLYESDIQDVYLVGSRARGTAGEGSDYDMAVVFPATERREKSGIQLSEILHSGAALGGVDMPRFRGGDVDIQVFFSDDPELEGYAKAPVSRAVAKPAKPKKSAKKKEKKPKREPGVKYYDNPVLKARRKQKRGDTPLEARARDLLSALESNGLPGAAGVEALGALIANGNFTVNIDAVSDPSIFTEQLRRRHKKQNGETVYDTNWAFMRGIIGHGGKRDSSMDEILELINHPQGLAESGEVMGKFDEGHVADAMSRWLGTGKLPSMDAAEIEREINEELAERLRKDIRKVFRPGVSSIDGELLESEAGTVSDLRLDALSLLATDEELNEEFPEQAAEARKIERERVPEPPTVGPEVSAVTLEMGDRILMDVADIGGDYSDWFEVVEKDEDRVVLKDGDTQIVLTGDKKMEVEDIERAEQAVSDLIVPVEDVPPEVEAAAWSKTQKTTYRSAGGKKYHVGGAQYGENGPSIVKMRDGKHGIVGPDGNVLKRGLTRKQAERQAEVLFAHSDIDWGVKAEDVTADLMDEWDAEVQKWLSPVADAEAAKTAAADQPDPELDIDDETRADMHVDEADLAAYKEQGKILREMKKQGRKGENDLYLGIDPWAYKDKGIAILTGLHEVLKHAKASIALDAAKQDLPVKEMWAEVGNGTLDQNVAKRFAKAFKKGKDWEKALSRVLDAMMAKVKNFFVDAWLGQRNMTNVIEMQMRRDDEKFIKKLMDSGGRELALKYFKRGKPKHNPIFKTHGIGGGFVTERVRAAMTAATEMRRHPILEAEYDKEYNAHQAGPDFDATYALAKALLKRADVLEALDLHIQQTKELGEVAVEAGVLLELIPLYTLEHRQKTGADGKPLKARVQGAGSTTVASRKKREFATLAAAIGAGYLPETMNYSAIRAAYYGNISRAVLNKAHIAEMVNAVGPDNLPVFVPESRMFVKTDKGKDMVRDFEKAGYRAVKVDGFTYRNPDTKNNEVVYAPDLIAKYYESALQPDYWRKYKFVRGFDTLARKVKLTVLTTSFFHFWAFARSFYYGYLLSGADINILSAIRKGLAATDEMTPTARFLILHGLTLGRVQDWMPKPGMRNWFEKLLFEKMGAGLKMRTAQTLLWREIHMHPNADADHLADRVAKLTNADFGGLNLEALGVPKSVWGMLRRAMLAPDWTVSNFLPIRDMFPFYADYKHNRRVRYDPAKARIAAEFWLRVAATAVVSNQILNQLIYGIFTPPEDKKRGILERFTWQEEHLKGKGLDYKISKFNHVNVTPLLSWLSEVSFPVVGKQKWIAPKEGTYVILSPEGHLQQPLRSVAPLLATNMEDGWVLDSEDRLVPGPGMGKWAPDFVGVGRFWYGKTHPIVRAVLSGVGFSPVRGKTFATNEQLKKNIKPLIPMREHEWGSKSGSQAITAARQVVPIPVAALLGILFSEMSLTQGLGQSPFGVQFQTVYPARRKWTKTPTFKDIRKKARDKTVLQRMMEEDNVTIPGLIKQINR